MKAISKYPPPGILALVLSAIVLTAFTFSACGKDSGSDASGNKNKVEWDASKTIYPDKNGNTILRVTGRTGTTWTAEIESGADWISFNSAIFQGGQSKTVLTGEVGTSLSDKVQYVYFLANGTNAKRTAVIEFTFTGEEPVYLELTQYSVTDQSDVYALAHDLKWPEIPEKKTVSDTYVKTENLIYVTHYASLLNQKTSQNYNARNYTLCMDKKHFASWWVAYPLHSIHTGSGRVDSWDYDPRISSDYQADMASGSYSGDWDRGHQIPNADRNGNIDMMAQTFYASNATPQWWSMNQNEWATLEGKVRSWICADTLYVVTGAWWSGNKGYTTDKNGKKCDLPDYYFKVVARTVPGDVRQTGDNLGSYPASQLQCIGFWASNSAPFPDKGYRKVPTGWIKSVKEIEDLTGFKFFPTLTNLDKTQKDTSKWFKSTDLK